MWLLFIWLLCLQLAVYEVRYGESWWIVSCCLRSLCFLAISSLLLFRILQFFHAPKCWFVFLYFINCSCCLPMHFMWSWSAFSWKSPLILMFPTVVCWCSASKLASRMQTSPSLLCYVLRIIGSALFCSLSLSLPLSLSDHRVQDHYHFFSLLRLVRSVRVFDTSSSSAVIPHSLSFFCLACFVFLSVFALGLFFAPTFFSHTSTEHFKSSTGTISDAFQKKRTSRFFVVFMYYSVHASLTQGSFCLASCPPSLWLLSVSLSCLCSSFLFISSPTPSEFFNIDPKLVVGALKLLRKQGRGALIEGGSRDETGAKFVEAWAVQNCITTIHYLVCQIWHHSECLCRFGAYTKVTLSDMLQTMTNHQRRISVIWFKRQRHTLDLHIENTDRNH